MPGPDTATRLRNAYPRVSDLAAKARQRIPFFAWEYLDSGTGYDVGASRNVAEMHDVRLTPRFMRGEFVPNAETELFGTTYSAPFGVAPVGLTGLMWPGAEIILAKSAAKFRVPYSLSTVATEAPEIIGPLADGMGWFQLYPPRSANIRRDLLQRAKETGFTTLLITADVPTGSTRERQVRAGVSVPPQITPQMIYRCAVRPEWSIATLRHGIPRFRGVEKYVDAKDLQNMTAFIGRGLRRHVGLGLRARRAPRMGWPDRDQRAFSMKVTSKGQSRKALMASACRTTARDRPMAPRLRSPCCRRIKQQVGDRAKIMFRQRCAQWPRYCPSAGPRRRLCAAWARLHVQRRCSWPAHGGDHAMGHSQR